MGHIASKFGAELHYLENRSEQRLGVNEQIKRE